jgi:surfeit locus 1 family protein
VSTRLKFWLITALALLAAGLTSSLGYWQLSRAAEKYAREAAIAAQDRLSALDGAALLAMADPLQQALHRRIQLRGQWLADKTVFLDNRQMHAKPGLYVITPFQPEGGQKVLLVQRGWVPRNFVDRTSVPRIDTPSGVVEIQGRISPPPSKLYAMGGPETGIIRQNLDMAQFSAESGLALMPVSIQQTGGPAEGLARDWPQVALGAEKNMGYAFQWFGLASLIALLYVWFQIVRRFITPRRA